MESIITEKKYPIRKKLILKSLSGANLLYWVLPILMMVGYFYWKSTGDAGAFLPFLIYSFVFLAPLFLNIILFTLRLTTFHYSFDEQLLTIRQGIIAKQESFMPYEVFQDVLVKQDLFDRIFNLASLVIENATQQPRLSINEENRQEMNKFIKAKGLLGSIGNKVIIAGLEKQDAEALKVIVLQKMKEHPTADIQAGL
ncbi:MAG: PH domain-containing protein [Candidatus Gribaldobacteria bacterium]|nr:PH domain-containing protein [Candidatus Gribaldobacteria bacterium]